jgi:hypothetical protein
MSTVTRLLVVSLFITGFNELRLVTDKPAMTTNGSFLSWFESPPRDLSKELSSLNLADIEPPRNPRPVLPKARWLFVYPCGTPIDFCFSDEVSAMRRDYWTQFIQVRIQLTAALYAKQGHLIDFGWTGCTHRSRYRLQLHDSA